MVKKHKNKKYPIRREGIYKNEKSDSSSETKDLERGHRASSYHFSFGNRQPEKPLLSDFVWKT